MAEPVLKSVYQGADQAVPMLPECPRSGIPPGRARCPGQSQSVQNSFALLSRMKTSIRSEPLSECYTVSPGAELGRGKFAVVRKYREKSSGKEYAAKFVRKRRKGQDCRQEIVHEIAVLELASACPWVIGLHEVYETASEMILVLEYAAGGEIFNQCVAERDEAFSEEDVRRLMRQILQGVAFLHSNGIVHLDLKPQNILLSSASPPGNIKIVDFGLSRVVSGTQELREIMGTPEYVAPEVLNFEPISTATDMWSIGVLAYVMLTGTSPFLGSDKQETFLNISQINISYDEEELERLDPSAICFMKSLLVKEPKARATANQCLQHQWLQNQCVQQRVERTMLSAEEEEHHVEEGRGQVAEGFIVMTTYSLGQCRQSEQETVTPGHKVISKRFKFEEPFSTLQEIIY